MKRSCIILTAFSLLTGISAAAQNLSGTYLFVRRDTASLYLDVYDPSPGSELTFEGHGKPLILFVFGGGFVGGSRDDEDYLPWFRLLNDNGYKVASIDYRLGLKGVEMKFGLTHLLGTAKSTIRAVEIGVEDLFTATAYLAENAENLGIDPGNIVLAGSSAGAMIALYAELAICNGKELARTLPPGFNYRGVISFAGAIMSSEGRPKYLSEPCPQLLLHGTADRTVQYGKTQFGKYGMFGTDVIGHVLKENGYVYNIIRYVDHAHDIASNLTPTWPEQQRFLEADVLRGDRRLVDATVDDPAVPKWDAATWDSLY